MKSGDALALLGEISPWPWMVDTPRGAFSVELHRDDPSSGPVLVVAASEGRGWRTIRMPTGHAAARQVLATLGRFPPAGAAR